MYPVAKRIFHLTQEKKLHLTMSFLASPNNPADEFSRNLSASDSMLSPRCWNKAHDLFGGPSGHNLITRRYQGSLNFLCLQWGVPSAPTLIMKVSGSVNLVVTVGRRSRSHPFQDI